MESLIRDVTFGARLLWKDKGFTATVLLTLALCIAGNVAIFSVVYSVLLKPLPVPEADRILRMYNAYPGATGSDSRGANGVPDYYDRLRAVDVFEELALYRRNGFAIGEGGTPEQLSGWGVTPSFFRLVRVPPALGRTFVDTEGEIGNEQKVVLSHGLWERLYGADPAVIGRDLRINSRPHEIVGVMPPSFTFIYSDVQLWVPVAFTDEQKSDDARHSNSWSMLGRLEPGATLAQAQAQVDALNASNLERFPQFKQILLDAGFRTDVVVLQDVLVEDIRGVLYLLWGGVGFVLLIGCVNVANLTLIRSTVRLKEIGLRQALGAGQGRLARQLLTEGVLVTTAAGVLGFATGWWSLGLLGRLGAAELPRGGEIAMDGVVIALSLAVVALIGCVLGLVPLLTLASTDLNTTLRQEGRSGTSSRRTQLFRNALAVVQVSIAFVLLIGAVLLLVSFQRILAIDTGFDTTRLLTASVSLPNARYPERSDLRAFAQRAADRIRTVPGVADVGITSSIPFGDRFDTNVVQAEAYVPQPGESLLAPIQIVVGDEYLQTLGVPLADGRLFDARDTAELMPVVIVDERLARKFWSDRSALGQRMYTDVELEEDTTFYTVVGVVREHTLFGVIDVPDQIGAYFFPYSQNSFRSFTFAIRTAGEPHSVVNAVRGEIAAIDPELPLYFVQTLEERIAEQLTPRRTPMLLALGFAGLALFLSAIGIYGVLAYRVTQRTKEFGIRLALGSTARQVFGLVLSEGMTVLGLGLGVGLVGAFSLRNAVASQLYDVETMDPIVLLSVMVVLGAIALLACVVPASRAMRVDPASSLVCD